MNMPGDHWENNQAEELRDLVTLATPHVQADITESRRLLLQRRLWNLGIKAEGEQLERIADLIVIMGGRT